MSLAAPSDLEAALLAAIADAGLPEPQREVRFDGTQRKFDFAWPAVHVACEVQGGIHAGPTQGHTRKERYADDVCKLADAVVLGWRLIWVTGADIRDGRAFAWLRDLLPAALAGSDAPANRPLHGAEKPQDVPGAQNGTHDPSGARRGGSQRGDLVRPSCVPPDLWASWSEWTRAAFIAGRAAADELVPATAEGAAR